MTTGTGLSERLRVLSNSEGGGPIADGLDEAADLIDDLVCALERLDEALTCRREDSAHYCPNCDNSLDYAREIARAALAKAKP